MIESGEGNLDTEPIVFIIAGMISTIDSAPAFEHPFEQIDLAKQIVRQVRNNDDPLTASQ